MSIVEPPEWNDFGRGRAGTGVQNKVTQGFRLSPQQKHLWSLQQLDHGPHYRAQCVVRIEGTLDPKLLTAALHTVFARHEVLRSTFHCLPGAAIPVQVITESSTPPIVNYDLSGYDPARQTAEIEAHFGPASQSPFDFQKSSPCRISLVTLSCENHILFLDLSALCADTASFKNLVRDISRSYSACLGHEEPSNEPPQYADLAEWQNELLESEDTKTARDHWRQQDLLPLIVLKLPFEKPACRKPGFEPRFLTSTIGPDIAAKIRKLVRNYDTSESVFFLACWQSLLRRLTGQPDFVVGLACDGRTYEGLQEAVGLFAKYLPVRGYLEEHLRFSQILEQAGNSAHDVLQWQEYFSWDQFAGSSTDIESPAFCSASFEFEEEQAKYCVGDLTFSIQKQHACADRFKVKLFCARKGDLLITELHYDSNLFRAQDVERLARQFQTLLKGVTNNPEASIGELEILSGSERQQLLIEFNATQAGYPRDKCLHQLFQEQAERTPDKIAVVFEGAHLTYAQLNARANQLAHHLQARGVGPDVPVAICVARGPEMMVGLLGILKAGGAYVPLDPAYPKERLAFMLEDAPAPVLLTQAHIAATMPVHRAHVLCLDSGWEAIGRESELNPVSSSTIKNLAYVIYTSGSTGQPKGVMIEHRSLVNYLCWVNEGLPGDTLEHLPLTTKLTFDMCLKQLFAPLLRGGEVWMLPEEVVAQPAALLSALGARNKAGLNCVPSLWKAMLYAVHSGKAIDPNATLEYLLFGGEQLSKELVDGSFSALPNLKIWNIYGPTEATANACAATIGAGDEVTIGRPIANTQIYILDSFLNPVPIGVQGELYIGGAGVARGYLNRPDLTADKFIPDPFSAHAGARLYKTGDLARYLPDGRIELLGRSDYQVKIRGFRVELGEIETALGEHPAVRAAVVLSQEDTPGEKRLVAYVVAAREAGPTANDLRSFLRQKLPEYMVPSALVLLDALPLMSNGKVDRRALPAVHRASPELEMSFVIPGTPTEEMLAEIWAEILGIERVGIHDNFFDLGGHSLLATQVVSRIRDAFGVEIPLRQLFETPTVAGLADNVEAAGRAAQNLHAPPILPVARDGDLPLSFAQRRLWFIEQLAPGKSAYNIPAAIRLKGPLNVVALERCLNEIVKRHEALRTTFAMVDGGPVQVIAPILTLALPVVDLRELSGDAREIEVRRLAAEEAGLRFDLARGPLLRIKLLRLGDEEHVGLLTMHHIVSDGWSTGILIREMAVLYEAFSSGRPSPLPELPIQYADFADWQRDWLRGEVLETQLAYWKEQLLGAPALLELPTEHSRPAVQSFQGAHRSLLLPKQLGEALKALSRHEGVTLFMTLLAAFKILLHRYTSQDDLVVGTPIANRNHTEIEGLIGFFANTLALRTDLSGNPSFRQLLRRVREVCLAAYSHQDLPFEKLVEELHPQRDLSRSPIFQVMFVINNALVETVELTGLTVSPIKGDSEAAHFDLTLQIGETEQGLMEAVLVYNTDLFEAGTIARMLGHFQTLLEAVIADPDRRLADLPLLTRAERHQLLVEWNNTRTDHPQDLCVHQLFEAQVERTPDAIAVVFQDQHLTYSELNRRANQLAHHLRALGVGPDVPVGVCLEQSLEIVIALVGVLKAGGVYVPLDPAYPNERLAFMLEDTEAAVLLTQERLVAGLPEHEARIVCLDSGWAAVAREKPDNPVTSTMDENLAYVIYTSGSTGRPKGVLVSHGSIVTHCRDIQRCYELDSSDRVLQFSSLSVDLSLEQILPTLIAGARLLLARAEVSPPNEFHRIIAEFGLTVLNIPTPYWHELVREWADLPELSRNLQPRLFIVGGDVMSPEALDRWQKTSMQAVRLINAYGPTETTITATAFEIAPQLGEHTTLQKVPIGRPLANREIYILDKYGNPVPTGVPGELHIGGAGLARGYLNRPDLTAEKFIPNPFSSAPGARLYQTGDRARHLPDGSIELFGRIDHQVKIRGFRVELEEIEAVLRQHPDVREAVVLAQQETSGEKRLVAYLVSEREHSPTADDLRGFAKDKLPEYMMPAVFVLLEAMPLMPNGKVDRHALPAPDQARPELEKAFVAPRDELELQLTHLWEEVLGVRPIGVRDNFFELGGHSLAAVRLFSLIEKKLGRRLPLATVFQGATVEHLAGILRCQARPSAGISLVAIQPAGNKRPLFLIHPAGGHVFPYVQLAHCLGLDQPCYGLQARGLEEGQQPHTRIEDMAAYYIEALRTLQTEGPYFLGGWSAGGVVAFEMAQQLHAQGQSVALLALLDARIPTPDEDFADEDFEATLLADFVRYFGLSLDPRESLARLPRDELLTRVLEQAKRAGLVPPDVEASQAHPFIELCKADFRATRNYVLHRYPGRVTLFKASQELEKASADATLGWSEWAAGGVEVHVVPGNHANMVYKPNVEVLAQKLRACLSQMQSAQGQFIDEVNPVSS